MSYQVNGKTVSKEELLEMLEDENTVVEKMVVSAEKPKNYDDSPLTNEGFDLPSGFFKSSSEGMDRHNASFMKMSFKNSKKLMGRNVYIIIADADDEHNEILENM